MLTISNIYGHGFDRQEVARLETLGFKVRPQASTYMGTQICRFLDFERGPALEVIDIEDHQAYRDFVPAGMVPYCPGISLILPDDSNKTLADFEREFSDLGPYTLHVNYDGSQVPAGPGWNYLNFERLVVPGTFTWLTACDPSVPSARHETAHPNGVLGVIGLVFGLESAALKGLARLAEVAFDAGVMTIGGVQVWSRGALTDFPALGAKEFPLIAIVVQARSLGYFAAGADRVKRVSFMDQSAVHIETNPRSWDLLVVPVSES
ncbi:MAG: hypothetical protein JW910_03755 [Anaerolineae bacterium]|nr:hypothetical protein [Anaerolineae bacterium]